MDTNSNNSQGTVRPPGRPATITKDLIREALQELTANNRPTPSLRRLRRHLGSGSLTTISRLRDEVVTEALENGDDSLGLTDDPLESKCDDHYRAMKAAIRQEMAVAAEDKIAEVENHCAQQVTAAEQRRDKVLLMRDLLNQRTEKAESTLAAREKELNTQRDKNEKLLSELEASKLTLADTNGRLDVLQSQLDTATEELSALQEEIVSTRKSYESAVEALTKEKDSIQTHSLSLKNEIKQLRSDKKELQHSADRRTDTLKNIQERLNDRTETINDLKRLKDQLLKKIESEMSARENLEAERQKLQSAAESCRLESTRYKTELQSELDLHTATKLRLKEVSEAKDKEISRLQTMYAEAIASETSTR